MNSVPFLLARPQILRVIPNIINNPLKKSFGIINENFFGSKKKDICIKLQIIVQGSKTESLNIDKSGE